MDGVELKPNDRICIGPSAIFLFKNKKITYGEYLEFLNKNKNTNTKLSELNTFNKLKNKEILNENDFNFQ